MRETGREPRKGERKTRQSHVENQRPLGSWNFPAARYNTLYRAKGNAMVAVSTLSWEEVAAPDFGTRQTWREAVAQIATKAHEKLPECNGRVDSAVKLVLAGDVELLADGTAKVAS